MTLFLLWIGTYCISCVVQQTSGVKDLSSLLRYDDSSLAAIRHAQSMIHVVRPRPNIRSHSVLYCFGTPIWPPWRHVKTLYEGRELGDKGTKIYGRRVNGVQEAGECDPLCPALKSEFAFFSVSIAIIPSRLLCQMQANFSEQNFYQPYASS